MEDSSENSKGASDAPTEHTLVATAQEEQGKPLDNVDPVWLVVVCILAIILTTARLTSSNVTRERPIAGSHYRGKVTPGWLKKFQKQETLRDDSERTGLQDAIRAKRR